MLIPEVDLKNVTRDKRKIHGKGVKSLQGYKKNHKMHMHITTEIQNTWKKSR